MYLKDTEAAKFLGLSVHTLRGYRMQGTGPKFLKMGERCIRYTEKALTTWAEARNNNQG